MKALRIFSALTMITLTITILAPLHSQAQEDSSDSPSPISKPENLAKRLEILSYAIDIYYDKMINLKTGLALSGLKITSPRSEMLPEDAKTLTDLENTQSEIKDAFKNYKADIETLSQEPGSLEIYENLKFLYDVVLIKAFLPRYDTVKGGFITRIFTFNTPQFAEELVPRTEALELFYKNFEINDKSNSVLNSDFRVSSFVKMHNSITAKLNRNKESNIYQTYPKHINAQSKAEEAYIYESIIRGETIPSPLPNLELSCSALFAG